MSEAIVERYSLPIFLPAEFSRGFYQNTSMYRSSRFYPSSLVDKFTKAYHSSLLDTSSRVGAFHYL